MPGIMNIRHFPVFVIVLLASCVMGRYSAFAEESIDNMYEALVPLQDRTIEAREAALRAGLEQVLVRYSGYSAAVELDGISEAIVNAENYVVEFSVETRDVPATDGLSTEESQFLWVRYNASQIDQLAQDYQVPIWSSLRPSVRYMVLQELWDQPTYMSRDTFPAMVVNLESLFAARGLPAKPFEPRLMDAKRVWDLSELDAYALLNEADADLLVIVRVLSGRLSVTRSEVVIVQDGDPTVLREQAGGAIPDADSALNKFVDSYSLSRAFLGGADQASEVFISVLGFDGFGYYRQVLNVLSGVEQVSGARLEALKDNQMMFRVMYGANHERLISSILRQIDLEQASSQNGALGTRNSPYILLAPGYRFSSDMESIFSDPGVSPQAVPIEDSVPVGPLREP